MQVLGGQQGHQGSNDLSLWHLAQISGLAELLPDTD